MMSPLPDNWNDGDRPGWDDKLADIIDGTFPERFWRDSFMMDLFHDGWVNPNIRTGNRNIARERFDFNAYDDYGIILENDFDFEAFFDWLYPPT